MKKNLIAGAMVFALLIPALSALAAPGDWLVTYRNDDDTDYTSTQAVERATTTYAILGGRYGNPVASWYYLGPGLMVGPSDTGYGINNYKISLNPNAINISDLTGTQALFDGKVSTSTFNTLSGTVTSQSSSISSINTVMTQINANLYGTSTDMTVLNASTTNGLVPKTLWNSLQSQVNTLASTTAPVTSVAGKTGTVSLVKGDVGLGSVDNTSDANKPISTSTQAALNGKFNTPTGTTGQYVRGDGTLATFPTTPTATTTFGTSRTIVTTAAAANGWQLSTTNWVAATYGAKLTSTASIASGQEGYVILEVASTNSTTASDWKKACDVTGNGQTYSLAVALQGIQPVYGSCSAYVPPGSYVRMREISVTGTPTYSWDSTQETTLPF